jgi:hypothetical protein
VTIDRVLDWILDLLTSYTLTTRDYTLQFTSPHAKSFLASSVYTCSCLVRAPNNGYSSASGIKSFLNGNSFPAELFLPKSKLLYDGRITANHFVLAPTIVLLITPLHGPSRKHRFQQYLYCCMRIRCCGNVFTAPLPRNSFGIFAYLMVVA